MKRQCCFVRIFFIYVFYNLFCFVAILDMISARPTNILAERGIQRQYRLDISLLRTDASGSACSIYKLFGIFPQSG